MRVGLTGGVGAGKSTLGAELEHLGAVRIDADVLAREVVEPGTPGLRALVERFGPSVLGPDGALDRGAMAALAFSEPSARADLNAIIHPLVAQRSETLMAAAPASAVVLYEIPLLAETGRAAEFDLVVVVEAPMAQRLERLAVRGLDAAAARARIDTQAGDEQRRAIADVVIVNDGSRADLIVAARRLWGDLVRRRDGG